jgi:hypothetical protein
VGTFTNRETIPFALGTLAGQGFLVGVYAVVFSLLLFALTPATGIVFTAAGLALMTAFTLGVSIWGIRYIRARTPHRLTISPEGVRAEWSASTRRTLEIPMASISEIGRRRWVWVHEGKANYAQFMPSAIEYESGAATLEGSWPGPAAQEGRLFVTEANARRLSSALEAWGVPHPPDLTVGEGSDAPPLPERLEFRVEEAKPLTGGAWKLTGVVIRGTLTAPSDLSLIAGPRSSAGAVGVHVLALASKDMPGAAALVTATEGEVTLLPSATTPLDPRPGDRLVS